MQALHYIDEDTAERAMHEEIKAREFAPRYDIEAPYVAEIVRQQVVARFGEGAINAGYKAITTIDGRLQTAANRALRLGLIEYDRRHGYRGAVRHVKLECRRRHRSELDNDARRHAAADRQPAGRPPWSRSRPTAARVYLRGGGFAQINWDGMSWARGNAANGKADAAAAARRPRLCRL